MSSTKKKVKFSGYCSVLPTNEDPLSDDLFDLDDTSIVFPSEEFDSVNRWDFDGVFNGPKDFLDSYKTTISPLVQSVERGENAMLIFSGVPFMDPMEYLTARNGRSGFMSMAADQLIKSAIHGRQKLASVTFSWFKVECSSSEAITDLLRIASTPNSSKGPDPNLVLREVGKGKGMFVSGLWEVELASSSDVESVIAHVSKLVPGCAHNGHAHSVFQLTLTQVKQGGNTSTSQLIMEERAPSRLTFVQLSGLAPVEITNHDNLTSSTAVYPWVDQLSDLLVWMNARRPSPPFHKSRILLLLRDAICGRMPCAMYYLLQPTVPAVPDNCLWLQLCFRIRDLVLRRANALPSQNASTQLGPGAALAEKENRTPAVSDAPLISSQMMYPAVSSASHQSSHSGTPGHPEVEHEERSFGNNHAEDDLEDLEKERADDDDISFSSLRRKAAFMAETHIPDYNYVSTSNAPGGPGGRGYRQGDHSSYSNRQQQNSYEDYYGSHISHYNTSEDEPFQYLPSPPPPGPPISAPDHGSSLASYVNPFDEVLAARGLKPAQLITRNGFRDGSPTRRHTASDAADMVRGIFHADHNSGENGFTRDFEIDASRHEHAVAKGETRGGGSGENSRPKNTAINGDSLGQKNYKPSGTAPAGNRSDPYMHRREERNMAPVEGEQQDMQDSVLKGLEPSDLEALLEALHRSRQENRDLSEAISDAEERCAKLTREYERLVAKVQEEGYFLRNKEKEKLKKVLQDLKDYEVYKQVMETAMSKMQTELDLLIKENKIIKEENIAYERQIRKLKTEGHKSQRHLDDLERDTVNKSATINELQEKLGIRSKERDSAIESLSHFKLKSSKLEAELSSKVKSQGTDIEELTARLEEMTHKFEAAEVARLTQEESSKQEIEKFRSAHLAALDKCMGYQEENDLLRASLSDIIEAQEQSIMNEESDNNGGA